jgi:hypothetical protein
MVEMTNVLTNEQVIAAVREIIEGHTYLEKDGNEYVGEIYVDYRDGMSEDTIKKITSEDNMLETFDEVLFDWQCDSDYYEYEELERTLKLQWDEEEHGEYADYEDIIQDFFRDYVHFYISSKHFLNQEVKVNVIIDSGDGNYDYTLNNLTNWYADNETNEIDEESSLLWLAQQQGYSKEDLEAALEAYRNGDDVESKFLHSVMIESANTTTSMNALSFFVSMTLGDYIDMMDNKKGLKLSSSTSAGLYDPWNGAGGTLELYLEKDVVIPHEIMEPHVDGNRGYGVDRIYGMCSSFWADTVLEII